MAESDFRYRPYAICIFCGIESENSTYKYQKIINTKQSGDQQSGKLVLTKSKSKKVRQVFKLRPRVNQGFQINNVIVQFRLLTFKEQKRQNIREQSVIELFFVQKRLLFSVFLPKRYNSKLEFDQTSQDQIHLCESILYVRMKSDLVSISLQNLVYSGSSNILNLLTQANQEKQENSKNTSDHVETYENIIIGNTFHGVFHFFGKTFLAIQQTSNHYQNQQKSVIYFKHLSQKDASKNPYKFCFKTDFAVKKFQVQSSFQNDNAWICIYEKAEYSKVHILSFPKIVLKFEIEQIVQFQIIQNVIKISGNRDFDKLIIDIHYFSFREELLSEIFPNGPNLRFLICQDKKKQKIKNNYLLVYQKYRQWIAVFSLQKQSNSNKRIKQPTQILQTINMSKVKLQFVYFTQIYIQDVQIQQSLSASQNRNLNMFLCYVGKQKQKRVYKLQCLNLKKLFRSSSIGVQLKTGQFIHSIELPIKQNQNIRLFMNQKILNEAKYKEEYAKNAFETEEVQLVRKFDFSALKKIFVYSFSKTSSYIFQIIELPFPVHSMKSDSSFFENLRIRKGSVLDKNVYKEQMLQKAYSSEERKLNIQFQGISQIKSISPVLSSIIHQQQKQFGQIRNFLSKIISKHQKQDKAQQFQVSQIDEQDQRSDQIQNIQLQSQIEELNRKIFHKNVSRASQIDAHQENKQAIDKYRILTLKNLINQIQKFKITKSQLRKNFIYQTKISPTLTIDIMCASFVVQIHINQTFQTLKLYFLYYQQNQMYLPIKMFQNSDHGEQQSEQQFAQFLHFFMEQEYFAKQIISVKILQYLAKNSQSQQISLLQLLCSKQNLLKLLIEQIKSINIANQIYRFLAQHVDKLLNIVTKVRSLKEIAQNKPFDWLNFFIKIKNKRRFLQQLFAEKLQQFETIYSSSYRIVKLTSIKKHKQILNTLEKMNYADWKQTFEKLTKIDPFKDSNNKHALLQRKKHKQDCQLKSIQDKLFFFQQAIKSMIKPVKRQKEPQVMQLFSNLVDQIETNIGCGVLEKLKAKKMHLIMLQVYRLIKNHVNLLNGKLERPKIINFVKAWHFLIRKNKDLLIEQKVIQKNDVIKLELLEQVHKYQRNTNCLIAFQQMRGILQNNKKRYLQDQWKQYQEKLNVCLKKDK